MIERYCMWCTASHNHQPMPHPEGAYALYAEAHEQIEKLRADNERLREALEMFVAAENSFRASSEGLEIDDWLTDAHEVAKKALSSARGEQPSERVEIVICDHNRRERIIALENEVATLRADNERLREKIKELEAALASSFRGCD